MRRGLRCVGVGGVGLRIGPFGLQGPVETFDLAVLPRAVGADDLCVTPRSVNKLRECRQEKWLPEISRSTTIPMLAKWSTARARKAVVVGPFSSRRTSE